MKADRSHTSDARNDGDTKMSARIEEWLSRMHETASSGTVRITATERGRDLGWAFEITTATDVGKIADTIDQTCTDAGLTRCELRAFTAEGRWFGQFLHKVDQPAEIVPANGLIALPAGLEDVVQHTLDATRSFAGLSFKAIVKNQEIAGQMVDRLDKQVAALTKENAEFLGPTTYPRCDHHRFEVNPSWCRAVLRARFQSVLFISVPPNPGNRRERIVL